MNIHNVTYNKLAARLSLHPPILKTTEHFVPTYCCELQLSLSGVRQPAASRLVQCEELSEELLIW